MLRLWLIRHAETDVSARGRFIGRTDVPLSTQGLVGAADLARAFDGERIDAVVSSPSIRAMDTARVLARRFGMPVGTEPLLREIDFGDFEGRTFDELESRNPAIRDIWSGRTGTMRFPNGEDWDGFSRRVTGWFEGLDRGADRSVLAFTHAGVTRAVIAHVLGIGPDAMFRIRQDFGCRNRIACRGEWATVELINGPASGISVAGPSGAV